MDKKICVYAICKNEEKFVDKWLDSMQEADYIVVLDTGSTDGTYKKLKADKRVTTVVKKPIKPWRFDVARNESMKLVPEDADILVCTDLDEVFNPGWAKVIKDVWKDDTTRIFYRYAWSHNEVGEPQDIFRYDKIHTRDYHWVYPVHEVLYPIKPDFYEHIVDVLDKVYLHHYPDKSKPRSYYFDLLKLSTEENPNDSHVRMLLAREYVVRDEWDKALEEFLEVLKMPDVDQPNKRLVLLYSLFQTAIIYEHFKNYDEALWYCQEFIKEDPTYREPYLLMGEVYNSMKMYTLAEATVKAGLEYGVQKYDWVERSTTWIWWPEDVLSISEFYLGKIDKAIEHVNACLAHAPSDTRLLKNALAFYKEKLKKTEENNNKSSTTKDGVLNI